MNLGEALENLKFDNRMKDWNFAQGLLTQQELDEYNKNLPDVTERSKAMELESEKRSTLNGDGSRSHLQ